MSEYIITATALVVALTALVGVSLTYFAQRRLTDRSEAEYDLIRRRAELSDMREYYESQISKLSNQLTATEDRWRDANHLVLDAQRVQATKSSKAVDPGRFLEAFGVDVEKVKVDRSLLFYLTPFSRDQEREFTTLKRVCEGTNLRVRRGDEERIEANILGHIVKNIASARFIVANINGRNPNVLYELGIAQALGKTTLVISKTLEDLPFDIQANRVITFSSYADLEVRLTAELVRAALIEQPGQP